MISKVQTDMCDQCSRMWAGAPARYSQARNKCKYKWKTQGYAPTCGLFLNQYGRRKPDFDDVCNAFTNDLLAS